MTPEQLDILYKIVVILAGSGGILFGALKVIESIVKSFADHRASQDAVIEETSKSDIEEKRNIAKIAADEATAAAIERSRQLDAINSLISVIAQSNMELHAQSSSITSQATGLGELAKELRNMNLERAKESAVQAETLHFREKQAADDRAERIQEATSFRDTMQMQAKAMTEGLAFIEQSNSQGVQTLSEKISTMSEELTDKLTPIDERLTHVATTLTEIKDIVKALPDQEAIGKVNRQLQEISKQLTDLQHTVAINAAGGSTIQTDADHATNVAADKAAFDGPFDPLANPQRKDKE